MTVIPDDLRSRLESMRVCRANGIPPCVLVPTDSLPWLKNIDAKGGRIDEEVDDLADRLVAFARRQIGTEYRAHATIQSAPKAFSCSTLVKYAFASVGIWMPRYAVDQTYRGSVVERNEWKPGTLAFWKGEFPIRDAGRAVGHIGIVCGDRRIIHAGTGDGSVQEFTPLRPESAGFVDPIPNDHHALVFLPTEERGLETALDIARWLQR